MERVNQIMQHPLYRSNQQRIEELEEERIFCKHGLAHSLDVARILYILVLERGFSVSKDVVYAAALLHDIGRAVQYEESKPHHEAGAEIAGEVLKDCGYESSEIIQITEAVAAHQNRQEQPEGNESVSLQSLLYEADKLSRNCFECKALQECYWENAKRNYSIKY